MSQNAKIRFSKDSIESCGIYLGPNNNIITNTDDLNKIIFVKNVKYENNNNHIIGITQYNIANNISKYNNKIYFHNIRAKNIYNTNSGINNINYINNNRYLFESSLNFINANLVEKNFVSNFRIVLNFKIGNYSYSSLLSKFNKNGIYLDFNLTNMYKNLYKNVFDISLLNLSSSSIDNLNNNPNYHITDKTNYNYNIDFIKPNSPYINTTISGELYNIYFTYIYKEQ